ncbi:zinc-type alcohol dehydrogenase [Raphidocelis subcapitata]|uniref:Zinc-type alcohol dehydrogenase n=1 Tax=Raphidocelis subcapitata TaxID=307507 RepID=A0A2V0NPJ1_9CHLO|nr:zinc-type alcohol dehydrogenase [Raphidocelis subcapitata]|eukprot:GBF89541.1 zinc-type alcohol dehydrogenase [Raphidocelis subcapitata]
MSGKAVAAADAAAHAAAPQARPPEWPPLTVAARGSGAEMRAVTWQGKHAVAVKSVPAPAVTDSTDAILRITSTAICGSDLHLYVHAMPGMKAGDVLGHEAMGVVEEVGPDVTSLRPGDRVAVCFDICGCGGACFFCSRGLYSSCAASNPSRVQAEMYGQPTGGFFGYSHLTGGWQGGQAERLRVPVADSNCLKLPDDVPDNQAVLLTDILPTAWHANELGEVGAGDVVAIWGAGPVGILAAHCAQHRGARRVILIDPAQYRLDFAAARLPGLETLNPTKGKGAVAALYEMTAGEPGGAPDVVIDAVGMHYASSLAHKAQMALQLETDSPEAINECIRCVRKGGRVSIVGAYAGWTNAFMIGAFMEKQLTMRGGQTPVQKYWGALLEKVRSGALNPALVVTHTLPLEEAPAGYEMFNAKRPEDGCIKVVLKTPAA